MLNDIISTYYEMRDRNEASHRERLDLAFDELQASAEAIERIAQMLTKKQEDSSGFGIKIIERSTSLKNVAWLLQGGRLVGIWNLDSGNIFHWIPGNWLL